MEPLAVSVQVSSHAPGVTPVAFVAVVEVIDADGEKHYETIASEGITDARRARILAELGTA